MAIRKQNSGKLASEKFRIKVTENGPYEVSGGVPLREMTIICDADGIAYEWREGKNYPLMEKYKLCRCGQSKHKPFCDNTHEKVNFDGTETASRKPYMEQAEEFKGPGLDLFDARILCTHARFCDRAGGIWELTEKSGDQEARKTAIEEARDCPSGRLVVWDKEGNEIEPEFEPSIVLVEDPYKGVSGPIWVRGRIIIEAADGTTYEVRNRVTLCRCGKSQNKPFCDGRHLND
jgi:CDGSH-type Zn-finger protein